MSKKLQEQATTTTTPTNWFVNIAGGVRQLTAAAFSSLIGSLLGTQTHAATAKTTLVDTDEVPLSDSAASNATKKITWANLWLAIKAKTDAVYAALSHSHSAADLTSGTIPDARFPGTLPALNGSALTNLNAAALTTGTIDVARIPLLYSGIQVVSSGGIADLTSPQQAEISKGAVITTTDGRRWMYTGSGSKTSEASYIESADVTPEWSVIANKPTTFAPPAPTTTVMGGVKRNTGSGGQFVKGIDADGSLLFDTPAGGGGGGANGMEDVAFVNSAGNDGTAVLGDPSKPFATLNAAHAASFGALLSGVSKIYMQTDVAGGLTITGDVVLCLSTCREWSTTIVPSIEITSAANVAILGDGRSRMRIGSITVYGTPGTAGADGSTPGAAGAVGGNGTGGQAVKVYGCFIYQAAVYAGGGGVGGNGAAGDESTPNGGGGGAGGAGGNAGTLELVDCATGGGTFLCAGGAGGNAGSGGSGYSEGGYPGMPGSGGNGGGGGLLRVQGCMSPYGWSPSPLSTPGGAAGTGYSDGTAGSNGAIVVWWSEVGAIPYVASGNALMSLVNGSFYSTLAAF